MFFVIRKYSRQYEWIYRSDDDTYVIMENLRQFLSTFDPHRTAVQMGSHMTYASDHYIHTGSGIAISNFAFVQLMQKFHVKECYSNSQTHHDDLELGKCLNLV
jgi:glycoprotein-N-acetylgalactosamine 3-beta-galactosyltransferase